MQTLKDSCPWCGSTISHEKFKEVEAKIRQEQQKELKATEAVLRKRFEVEKQAAEKRAKAEGDKKAAALNVQLQDTLTKLKQSEAAKYEMYKRVKKEAEQKANQERDLEVKNLRLVLEKDRDQKLLKQQERFQVVLEASQKKADQLIKQLQEKTAQDIEGSSVNVFEELQAAFPDDRLALLHKGKINEKILHEIIYKGIGCGSIVVDSRNRQRWHDDTVSKLRIEQVELEAEHAILSTTVFPKTKKDLCIEDQVIIVNPKGVTHVVHLLRETMIKMHVQGLSMVDRASKTHRLYEFISSQGYAQKCNEAASISDAILELEVQEVKQHKKVWEQRGSLTKRLKTVLHDIDTSISSILEDRSTPISETAAKTQSHLRRVAR
jgi:hypothetical protein